MRMRTPARLPRRGLRQALRTAPAAMQRRRRRGRTKGVAMQVTEPTSVTYGVMAEFDSAQTIVDAARLAVAEGFSKVEAYTPVPIEELNDIIHKTRTILPKLVLAGGIAG